jgi:hypothetical protein
MVRKSPLDDRATAQFAWARYKRLMKWMTAMSFVAVLIALAYLYMELGDGLTIHMIIATSAGVGLSVLLGAALMGLVFLSSGTGHDESIEDPFEDEVDRDDDETLTRSDFTRGPPPR